MPTLMLHDYQTKLLELNDEVYHVYIESDKEIGGGRDVVFLRQHDRGVPLTLRSNYAKSGTLEPASEKRDTDRLAKQFQTINYTINCGKILCVPIHPLVEELTLLEKYIPNMAGYINKHLEHLNLRIQAGRI
jgi:hypothetical protein